jgi:nucleoside 2-deoxyribosyltransferase
VKKLNIYCAGCMSHYHKRNEFDRAIKWRTRVKKMFGTNVCLFDPTRNFDQNVLYDPNGVPYQNLYFLNRCHIMLLNLDNIENSPGTCFEVFNYFFNNKPVIAFGESEWYDNPHIQASISARFATVDDAITYIKSMYL